MFSKQPVNPLPLDSNTKSGQQGSLRQRLSQKMARISSLDSTRTSSSLEVDPTDHSQHRQVMPLISITSNDHATSRCVEANGSLSRNATQKRHEQYNNYYGRPRIGLAHDDEDDDDDDDDDYEDPRLSMPYSSSAMNLSTIVRQQTDTGVMVPVPKTPDIDEDPLDDRQGMNNTDQQFTKGEKMARPSLDGSIVSELRLEDGSKRLGSGSLKGGLGSKKDKQRRSKSPSSMSNIRGRNRHSRRGFLGLASRLKLTRKHESIAKLQLSILNSRFVSLKTMDRDLMTFLPKERMTPKDFEERVKLMRKYDVLSQIEYRFACHYETYVCRHATQESNQPKNNYKKCIPYDYNRVVLKTLPNVPDSDYINASHVDSYLKPNAYIAAQGPNENTIEDFWRMIWEQKTFVVVMLTKVFDFIRVMCNQYWPVELNKPERYGNLEVTLLYEEPLADFVIRTIRLTKLRGSQQANAVVTEDGGDNKDQAACSNVKSDWAESSQWGSDDEFAEFTDEDTSAASDELIANMDNLNARDLSSQVAINANSGGIPPVRAPKFIMSAKSARRVRRLRDNSTALQVPPSPTISVAPGRSSLTSSNPQQASTSNANPRPSSNTLQTPRPNEFLGPFFGGSATNLSGSSSNIPGGSIPGTPLTPSSAGLDRSSATRRAVKKKRRIRQKNTRPMRTQFLVPDESQLVDDDEEDELGATGHDENSIDGAEEAGTKPRPSNERIIYQFHYHSWASHTCPFINSLLHFRRRVRICMDEMSKSGKNGPTVVHCNDGCGRTGTYLCIDANLELVEEDNVYDVFNYTKKMRQSRKFLIENLEQYKFVYDTIEEAMFCGKTWFPVSELHKRLKHKSQRSPNTKKNEYQREYEKITRMTSKFSIGDCAGGHRVENREKNRDVSTVPPDNFRPYLTSFQTNDSTDYINAVFVDGYTRSKEYIVTEWPLHKTISDFWSLIYDHDCNSVILLANPGESSTYPSFLPSEKELRRKFGPVFSAEMVSYTHYQNIKSWIYTINKKIVSLTEVIAGVKSEAKTTQVFQITCWPQGHRVPTSTNALVELMNMVERWRQRTAYGPVCVVSLNGKSRAGVYCAANVAIEQVVQHSEVDVFQAVKTVRRHRPQLIENMTEYKYCYDLILHYVLHYVNQSPANI